MTDNVSINPCLACGDSAVPFKLFPNSVLFHARTDCQNFLSCGIALMQYMIYLPHFLTSCLCIKKTLSFFLTFSSWRRALPEQLLIEHTAY